MWLIQNFKLHIVLTSAEWNINSNITGALSTFSCQIKYIYKLFKFCVVLDICCVISFVTSWILWKTHGNLCNCLKVFKGDFLAFWPHKNWRQQPEGVSYWAQQRTALPWWTHFRGVHWGWALTGNLRTAVDREEMKY